MDDAPKSPGKKTGSTRAFLWIAIMATLYSVVAYGSTRSGEQKYYSEHTLQKTLILRIPGELTQVERNITQAQVDLTHIQAEIRNRLGQK
jgi:hypothetical protein